MKVRTQTILFAIREGGKLGFMDANGKVAIPAQFQNDALSPVHHEGAVDFSDWLPVKTKKGWGYIDATGAFKLDPQFALACPFSEDLAAVSRQIVGRSYGVPQGRWGYIDRKGKTVVAEQFGAAEEFHKGLAAVAAPNADGSVSEYASDYGLIDSKGKTVLPAKFERIFQWQEGLALTWKTSEKIGYLDEKGRVAIPCEFTGGNHFESGFARIEKKNKCGLLDKTGKVVFWSESVIPSDSPYGFMYPENVCTVSEGLVLDVKKAKCGFRDTRGKVIIDYEFDDALGFSEGLAAVKVGKKWGFVDKRGEVTISPSLDEPASFREGLAQAKVKLRVNGKAMTRTGFIDPRGDMAIEPRFTKADERELQFAHGLCAVVLDKRRAYVDTKGTVVWHE